MRESSQPGPAVQEGGRNGSTLGAKGAFTYEPLPTDEPHIRLVELLPSSSAEICCNLRQVKFDGSCPTYEALSYCWGGAKETASIRCNGGEMEITSSLHEALTWLCPKEGSRLLWIDQLTINQSDMAEKSSQVAMMRDIYARAHRTLVWIGVDSDLTLRAFDVLERVAMSQFPSIDARTKKFQRDSMPHSDHKLHGETFSQLDGAYVARLLQKPWFRRVWIIQEACVSTNVRIVQMGRTFNFDLVHFAIGIALSKRLLTTTMNGLLQLHTISRIRAAYQSNQRLPLSSLLSQSRAFNSTVRLDSIYALYGLAAADPESRELRPDYTIGARELFMDTTVTIIRAAENLDVLELCGGEMRGSGNDAMPLWVPAYQRNSVHLASFTDHNYRLHGIYGEELIYAGVLEIYEDRGATLADADKDMVRSRVREIATTINPGVENSCRIPHYRASKDSRTSFVQLEHDGTIHLTGQLIDNVRQIGNALPPMDAELSNASTLLDEDDLSVTKWAKWLKDLAFTTQESVFQFYRVVFEREQMVLDGHHGQDYPTGEPLEIVLRKTICANQTCVNEEITANAYKEWRRAALPMKAIISRKAGGQSSNKSPWLTMGAAGLGNITGSRARVWFAQLLQVSYERRLAWTKRGYLALLPAEAQETDCIVLLKGGRLPFVVRPSIGAWRMIGPCYVHGVMDGELFDEDACVDMTLL